MRNRQQIDTAWAAHKVQQKAHYAAHAAWRAGIARGAPATAMASLTDAKGKARIRVMATGAAVRRATGSVAPQSAADAAFKRAFVDRSKIGTQMHPERVRSRRG